MEVRFRADLYHSGAKAMVEIFDHKSGETTRMSLSSFNLKREWYGYNGGMIFGQKDPRIPFPKSRR